MVDNLLQRSSWFTTLFEGLVEACSMKGRPRQNIWMRSRKKEGLTDKEPFSMHYAINFRSINLWIEKKRQ